MNKLLSCRKYLSLQETQDYLSKALKESVSLQDIYGLVLDGLLTLSIRLTAQEVALKGKFIKSEKEETKKLTTECSELTSSRLGNSLVENSHNERFVHDQRLHNIDGVLDVLMCGTAVEEIGRLRNGNISLNAPKETTSRGGFYLREGEEVYLLLKLSSGIGSEEIKKIRPLLNPFAAPYGLTVNELVKMGPFELWTRFGDDGKNQIERAISSIERPIDDIRSYMVATNFPSNSEYVIKIEEITRFITEYHPGEAELSNNKPLITKQRNSYLRLISVLLKEKGINASDRGITSAIQLMMENHGEQMSENTIRSILKEVVDLAD